MPRRIARLQVAVAAGEELSQACDQLGGRSPLIPPGGLIEPSQVVRNEERVALAKLSADLTCTPCHKRQQTQRGMPCARGTIRADVVWGLI